jgi:hypothetical protein
MAQKEVWSPAQLREHFKQKAVKRPKPQKPVFYKKIESPEFPITVPIVPLSVNAAWKGERFRSEKYKEYSKVFTYMLPNKVVLPKPPFEIRFWFGLSSSCADWDNPIKPNLDLIAAKYGFNDKLIKRGIVEVEEVKKGEEYVRFEILEFKKQ